MGQLHTYTGNYDTALALLEESLALARSIPNNWYASDISSRLGELHFRRREPILANTRFRLGLKIAQYARFKELIGQALFGLASVVYLSGDVELAKKYAGKSLKIYESLAHFKVEQIRQWLSAN